LLSIEKKLSRNPGLLFAAVKGSQIIGTVMGGYDGHRGWIYSFAMDKHSLRQGIGTALMEEIERRSSSLGRLKVNPQVMASKVEVVELYEKRGFLREDRVSMGKRVY